MEKLWVLGAQDPEMDEIENLLRSRGEEVVYAEPMTADRRVRPGELASPWRIKYGRPVPDLYVLVEVVLDTSEDDLCAKVVRIDHHAPGDPGFGRPAAEAIEASSLGQVARMLGVELTPRQRVVAACDHNLRGAYAGEVVVVDPKDVRRFRIAAQAAFRRVPEAVVEAEIEAACAALRFPAEMHHWGAAGSVAHFDVPVPGLPEAGALTGLPYTAVVVDAHGNPKTVASGDEVFIRAFMAARNVPGLYGDPARGFAGHPGRWVG